MAPARKGRRVDEREARRRVKETHGEAVDLVDYAGTTKAKSTFRCLSGHTWSVALRNVVNGSGCRKCTAGRQPLSEQEARRRIQEAHGGEVVLVEYGGGVAKRSTFGCAEGHTWSAVFGDAVRAVNGCKTCASARPRVTEEEARRRVLETHGAEITLVEYGGTPGGESTFRCSANHAWCTTLNAVSGGAGCRTCWVAQLCVSEEEAHARVRAAHGDEIALIEYGGGSTAPSTFRCSADHVWSTTLNNVTSAGSGCGECWRTQASVSEQEARQRVQEVHGGEIDLVEYGGGAVAKSTFRCSTGHVWSTTLSHVVNRGSGCNRCARGRSRISEEEARKRVVEAHGGEIDLVEYGGGTSVDSTFRCSVDHVWSTTLNNVTSNQSGCRECWLVRLRQPQPADLDECAEFFEANSGPFLTESDHALSRWWERVCPSSPAFPVNPEELATVLQQSEASQRTGRIRVGRLSGLQTRLGVGGVCLKSHPAVQGALSSLVVREVDPVEPLTLEDVETILSQPLPTHGMVRNAEVRARVALGVMFDTGARGSQTCLLEWSDLDFGPDEIFITWRPETLKGVAEGYTSTIHRARDGGVFRPYQMLQEWREGAGNPRTGAVFTGPRNSEVPTSLENVYNRFVVWRGLINKRIATHSARSGNRTHTVHVLGDSISAVAATQNSKSVATAAVYVRPNDELLEERLVRLLEPAQHTETVEEPDRIYAPTNTNVTPLARIDNVVWDDSDIIDIDLLDTDNLEIAASADHQARWAQFRRWCEAHNRQPLPASPETAGVFLAAHREGWRKARSWVGATTAISHFHRRHNEADPIANLKVDSFVRRMGAEADPTQRFSAATVEEFCLLHTTAVSLAASASRSATRRMWERLAVTLSLGFFGAMRIGDVCAIRGDGLSERDGMLIAQHSNKAPTSGTTVVHLATPTSEYEYMCPIGAVEEWASMYPAKDDEPFFGVQVPALKAAFNSLREQCGLEHLTWHCLRVGFVTEAAHAGWSQDAIRAVTGHQSDSMIAHYCRTRDSDVGRVAGRASQGSTPSRIIGSDQGRIRRDEAGAFYTLVEQAA